jgi:hypothetical protein
MTGTSQVESLRVCSQLRRAEDAERPCWQCLQVHNVPLGLKESMQDHLRLHFSSQEASDEEVLAIYPAPIRRRILRHLYMGGLKRCYLFTVGSLIAPGHTAEHQSLSSTVEAPAVHG